MACASTTGQDSVSAGWPLRDGLGQVGGRPLLGPQATVQLVPGDHRLGGDRGPIRAERGLEALRQVIGPGNRGAAAAAAGAVVPAVDARVLTAVDAEVERLVECLELCGGEHSLLVAHRVTDRVGESVLARQVVLEPTEEAPRLAQRVEAGRRTEFVARPAAFAEGFGECVCQCGVSSPPSDAGGVQGPEV